MPTRSRPVAPTDTLSPSADAQSTASSTASDLGAESLSAAAQALTEATRQSVETLSAAAQALTQATQQLTTTAAQLSRAAQGRPGVTDSAETLTTAGTQILAWEDDPFSEASPTPNPPKAQPITDTGPGEATPPP
jgi:hypothetical protein